MLYGIRLTHRDLPSRVAKASALSYVVADLSALEHAWSLSRVYSPATYKAVALELCVSTHDVWIQGRFNENRGISFQPSMRFDGDNGGTDTNGVY